MAKKKNRTQKHQSHELIENPEVLAEQFSKTEHFIEKHKTLTTVIGAALLVGIVSFMLVRYYFNIENQNAQKDLFQAVYYFEADSLGKGLNGDGNNYGFLEIIDEYAGTDAANLANYYAGATYLKLGDYENAVKYLEVFAASDYLIQARAYALIGDAKMELEHFEEAAGYYQQAANYKPNKQFSPTYLTKAAIANETAGNLSEAKNDYQAIVDDFYGVAEYQNALKQSARLSGLLQ